MTLRFADRGYRPQISSNGGYDDIAVTNDSPCTRGRLFEYKPLPLSDSRHSVDAANVDVVDFQVRIRLFGERLSWILRSGLGLDLR